MKDIFDGSTDRDIIKRSTIYEERLADDGRRFVYRYFGLDMICVVNKVEDLCHNIDTYRSPTHSAPYKFGEYWACDMKYYGLD